MKLKGLLENQIHAHVCSKNIEASVIIMHPATYEKIVEECVSIRSMAINYHDVKQPTYRGLKIRRSLDVEVDKFEIF